MSTPEERKANLAKQKLFQLRHPEYARHRCDPLRLRRSDCARRGNFRTFELCDPRDPLELPRIIGYTDVLAKPSWSRLWSVKHLSRSRWAAWLRELDGLGLRPDENPWGTLGVAIPIGRKIAHEIVQSRLRSINIAETGDPREAPDWCLRSIETRVSGEQGVSFPVGCLNPDNSVIRYPSIRVAARAVAQSNNIGCQVQVRHHVWTVTRDAQGRLWWDD